MKTYTVRVKYSKDGKSWSTTCITVKAESDLSAIAQVSTRYNYVSDIRVISSR